MDEEQLKALGLTLADQMKEVTSPMQTALDEQGKSLESVQTEMQDIKAKMAVSVPGAEEERKNWSWARAIKGITTNDWEGAGFEKDMFSQTSKAMGQGTDSAGGYIVPTEYVAEIIELVYANTVLDKLGITRFNATSAPVEIPRLAGGATGYWVAENAPITASDLTLEDLSLSPKMVAGMVKSSVRLVSMANPSVEQMIMRDLATVLAQQIDIKALNGDGTGNTPVGILNTANILTNDVGVDGDDLTYDFVLDMLGKLEDADTARGNLGFAMAPAAARRLRKQKIAQYTGQTDGQPVFAPIVTMDQLAEYCGANFATTTQLPVDGTAGAGTDLSAVIGGNWQDFILAQWGSLVLESSRVAGDNNGGAFSSHQVWFKAVMEVDFGLRHPESFVVASNVKTTD